MIGDASFSSDETHRYTLSREWMGCGKGTVMFVMLNPSTADADVLDPTVRRCVGFAKRWGAKRLVVTNLYSVRSTDPRALLDQDFDDPKHQANAAKIQQEFMRGVRFAVCAWGAYPTAHKGLPVLDISAMAAMFSTSTYCLGLTKAGAPRHPLYVKADAELIAYP